MTARATLVRSIGRWGLAGLILNNIVGSGVFALPGTVAARLGWWSLAAFVVGAALAAAIILAFAEVAARFDESGGPYLYARAAFGRLAGIEVGWMTYFVRVLGAAVQINLLTAYLAELWAPADGRMGRAVVALALAGVLCALNVRGVSVGSRVSSAFAIAKLVVLLAFAAAGVVWLVGGHAPAVQRAADPSASGWLGVILLLMFSYGGFEAALIPAGEVEHPRRAVPFGVVTGLGAVVVVYLLVQVTVLATLADPGATSSPLAASARVLLGVPGAVLMTAAAALSVVGWSAAATLALPRLTYAMAERGDMPRVLARLHPRWRTPWASIAVYGVLVFVLSLQGTLLQNIGLAVVSRLLVYGTVCATLWVFRARDARDAVPAASRFRAPLGSALATIGVATSVVLLARTSQREMVWLAAVMLLAFAHWALVARRPVATPESA